MLSKKVTNSAGELNPTVYINVVIIYTITVKNESTDKKDNVKVTDVFYTNVDDFIDIINISVYNWAKSGSKIDIIIDDIETNETNTLNGWSEAVYITTKGDAIYLNMSKFEAEEKVSIGLTD